MNSVQQLLTTASQSPKIVNGVLTANVSAVIATALEVMPLVFGTIASVVGLIASVALLLRGDRQHKVKMKILIFDLEERKNRKGKRTRRDDND